MKEQIAFNLSLGEWRAMQRRNAELRVRRAKAELANAERCLAQLNSQK